jgi:hypothetical protein
MPVPPTRLVIEVEMPFAPVAAPPSKGTRKPAVIEVERHFASVATMPPGNWIVASKALTWM